MRGFLRRNAFVLLLLLLVCAADRALFAWQPVVGNDLFTQNDFELTQRDHPEQVWDKVFFGNSIVISAYIEQQSASGYVNLGIDYGKVTDLLALLEQGQIEVGSEIVIGANFLTFMDDLDTNPTYIWHKRWFEPYVYFQRDRFSPLLTGALANALSGQPLLTPRSEPQQKALYHGVMTASELAEKEASSRERFEHHPLESFADNLAALDELCAWCEQHNVRLRLLWMPWNPQVTQYDPVGEITAQANAICERWGVEIHDASAMLGPEYFHDIGHLDYELGAPQFTLQIDPWLREGEQ